MFRVQNADGQFQQQSKWQVHPCKMPNQKNGSMGKASENARGREEMSLHCFVCGSPIEGENFFIQVKGMRSEWDLPKQRGYCGFHKKCLKKFQNALLKPEYDEVCGGSCFYCGKQFKENEKKIELFDDGEKVRFVHLDCTKNVIKLLENPKVDK